MRHSEYIQVIKRSSLEIEESIKVAKIDSPKQFLEFIEHLHKEMDCYICPDPWVMDVIYRCFKTFEAPHRFMGAPQAAPLKADTTIRELTDWMKHPCAMEYCNDFLNSDSKFDSIQDLIQKAQEEAMFKIYCAVYEFAEVGE